MSNEETEQDKKTEYYNEILALVKKTHKPRLKPLSKNNLIGIIVELTAISIMLQNQIEVANAAKEQQ